MPSIDDIAAEYVERAAALDPCYATYAGIAGHDHELADLGADGFAGRAGLDRSTLAALDAAEAPAPREQVARAAMSTTRLSWPALPGSCTSTTSRASPCGRTTPPVTRSRSPLSPDWFRGSTGPRAGTASPSSTSPVS